MTVIIRMLGRLDTEELNMSHQLVQISLSLTPRGSPQPGKLPGALLTGNTLDIYRKGNSVLRIPQ